MTLLGNIARWLGRHALVFVLLVAALTIGSALGLNRIGKGDIAGTVARLEAAEAELKDFAEHRRGAAVTVLTGAERQSQAAVAARLATVQRERAALGDDRPGALDMIAAPKDAIVASVEAGMRRELLDQEIGFLEALQRNLADRGAALAQAASFDGRIAAADRRIAALDAAIAGDEAQLRALAAGSVIDRYALGLDGVTDLADFYTRRRAGNLAARDAALATRADLVAQRRRIAEVRALATPAVAMAALEARLEPLAAATAGQRALAEATIEREARKWYQRLGIDKAIRPALWALLAIILTPFLIRALFYWVLAPLASLQAPIRLLDPGAPIAPPPGRSTVSTSVTLAAGEELLVKQGFVQTVSLGGAKATQWLLDARHPISSVAAGLLFLTRVRGAGAPTTVSATHDPFAEVTVLALPEGAAVVLQPRALAGVVQAIERPLRITSHWRLGTLNAWLTWQLRFLVFHGPVRVILKGGRGVRIENSVGGRSIGQDQLIGFSAGLAYSTGRTETFLPYLFGQEQLLKDRVAAGEGLLIAEEAPMAGRRGGGIAHGLEGAMDAFLKVFGI